MKKIVLTVITCCGITGVAHAQSSVTLYGLIDEGLNINSNMGGSRSYALQSGALQGSRFGFRGTEDLGGGLKAVFLLENGFDNNTGKITQGGVEFGRQAFVGLSSHYGTVTLGRQYDSGVDFVGPLEVANQWGGTVTAHPGDLDNLDGTFRTNNAIKFTSVSYGGFSFGGMYSLGGVAGDVTRDQVWSLAARYSNGPLVLAASYKAAHNPNIGFFGTSNTSAATAVSANTTSPAYSGFLSAHTYHVAGAGAAYTLGAATVGVVYSNTTFGGLGDLSSGPNPSGYSGSVHFNSVEANFKYQITPALLAGIAYDYTKSGHVVTTRGTNDGATYNLAMASIDYFLSKRTDVYLLGVYETASGTDSRNLPAVAAIANQTSPSRNGHQALLRLGIRHKF